MDKGSIIENQEPRNFHKTISAVRGKEVSLQLSKVTDDGSTSQPSFGNNLSWSSEGHTSTISKHPAVLRSCASGMFHCNNGRKSRATLENVLWQAFSNRPGVMGWL